MAPLAQDIRNRVKKANKEFEAAREKQKERGGETVKLQEMEPGTYNVRILSAKAEDYQERLTIGYFLKILDGELKGTNIGSVTRYLQDDDGEWRDVPMGIFLEETDKFGIEGDALEKMEKLDDLAGKCAEVSIKRATKPGKKAYTNLYFNRVLDSDDFAEEAAEEPAKKRGKASKNGSSKSRSRSRSRK